MRVDEVAKDLRQISDDARKYWSTELSAAELVPLSIAINTKFLDVSRQLGMLEKTPGRAFARQQVSVLLDQVLDEATGADFESPNRVIDPQRATNAAALADELRMTLLDCRRLSLRWWPR
ncbi:hypothetical protein [Dongia sedimenti]|uniref:Uncharacterized protein n=1 Tax=Dongia sedimenti TaxID=3064282 RepID=A0ABU0YV06_9PROT|nr:hypothetical protein [Rhodospirillaceae bacterium R-7]